MTRDEIPADLHDIAQRPWPNGADCYETTAGNLYVKAQWLQARQLLGLESPEVTEAEDEAWEAMEEKQAGNRSKYHREIKPGVWVDVYDVLHAWRVQNPALQHLIKKALQPGERGHKTREQDMKDIIASALRAGELGE
jgi:hypothetical protein